VSRGSSIPTEAYGDCDADSRVAGGVEWVFGLLYGWVCMLEWMLLSLLLLLLLLLLYVDGCMVCRLVGGRQSLFAFWSGTNVSRVE